MKLKSILENEVNSHMEHISDLAFIEGVAGIRKAIMFMRDVRDTLRGSVATGAMTVKYDGAPAVVLGIDPADNKFFVAKKGIFNKEPKLYKSIAEIESDSMVVELKDLFKLIFTECGKLGIKTGIYQGDMMFTQGSKKKEAIDGVDMVTFHPNTIMYAVPVDSDMGRRINQAKVGLAFHTTYSGSIGSLKASFGKSIVDKFKEIPGVWAVDATFSNDTGKATFNAKESAEFDNALSNIGKRFNKSSADTINSIKANADVLSMVKIYINSIVKAGQQFPEGRVMAAGFFKFAADRFQKMSDEKKMQSSKDAIEKRREEALSIFSRFETAQIVNIFELFRELEAAKGLLITVLNRASALGHFVRTKDGLKVTAPEGFVAINMSGQSIKLVDRLVFSTLNFSPDILKGWQR